MTTAAWIYWITGAALGGVGFYLASWALLSDWLAGHRKHRRCAKCWYDMGAVVGLKCPECGREAKSENRLHRSRRRWGWVAVGTAIFVAGFGTWIYSVGRAIGWHQVLPLWIQVRLVDLIGADAVMLSTRMIPGGSKVDADLAARIIEIALPIADGKKAGDRYGAESAIARVAPSLTDQYEIGCRLLDMAIAAPPGMIAQTAKSSAQILGKGVFLDEFLRRIRSMPLVTAMGGPTGHEFWALNEVVPALTEDQVPAFAELAMRIGQLGHRFPNCDAPITRFADRFFAEFRRLYDNGSPEVRAKIMWFLATNSPDEVIDHPGMVWFAREACRLLDSSDKAERDRGSGLVHQFRRPGVLPVLPEIVQLMSSTREATGRYARNTLANVRLEPNEDARFVAALCDGLRNGNDFARVLILDVLSVRAMLAKPGVRDALLEAASKTNDTALGEKMLQLVIATDMLSLFRGTKRPAAADFIDVRHVLLDLLDRGGVQTEFASRCLGRLPNPDPATLQRLHSMMMDPMRPLADRAAARDALLHIRDRANPGIDPLAPLELAAPK